MASRVGGAQPRQIDRAAQKGVMARMATAIRARRGILLAFALVLLALPTAAGASGVAALPHPATPAPDPTTLDAPPALPPQPGSAPGRCQAPTASPGTWSLLGTTWSLDTWPPAGTAPFRYPQPWQIVVDPWVPCLVYRVTDTQSIERSNDGGATWTVVFHDDVSGSYTSLPDLTCSLPTACVASTKPFTASWITIPGPRRIVVGERGNGDAVIGSDDAGTTWTLRDNGIGGTVSGQPVRKLYAAPSDAKVMYAVTTSPGDDASCGAANISQPLSPSTPQVGCMQAGGATGLFVTRDGGASWLPTTLPRTTTWNGTGDLLGCQVDPAEPGHIWCVVVVSSYANLNHVLLESTDYGTTWTQLPQVPAIAQSNQEYLRFLVIRSARHPLRLFLAGGPVAGHNSDLISSDDDGATWKDSPLPLNAFYSFPEIAADPADPERMLYAGLGSSLGWSVYYTADAFDTAQPVPGPGDPVNLVDDLSPLTGPSGAYDNEELSLQADRAGNFYVPDYGFCFSATAATCSAATNKRYYQRYWRLTPPAPAPVGGLRIVQPAPPGAGPAPGTPANQLTACPLPSFPRNGNVPGYDTLNGNYDSGAVAFDGQDLLYTDFLETGPADYQGVIHRLNSVTCQPKSDIVVRFDPADLARLSAAGNWCGDRHPAIDDMTYDPSRNLLWVSLRRIQASYQYKAAANCSTYDGTGTWLFRVALSPGVLQNPVMANAQLAFTNGCGYILSYDIFSDTLWTCDLTGQVAYSTQPGRLRAADGASVPTCMRQISTDYLYGMATWTSVAPNRVYVQNENDQNFYEYDTATCAITQTFVHRDFGEPTPEDEQIACDGASFGLNAAVDLGPIVWMRDANTRTVVSYTVPRGTCPLASLTHYFGPRLVAAGAPARLCATLTTRTLFTHGVIAHQPMVFSVNGTPVGTAISDAAGTACIDTPITLRPGTYPVDAGYPGNRDYVPSHDSGLLTVFGAPGGSLLRRNGSDIAPIRTPILLSWPASGPPPQGAGDGNTAFQAQTEAQAQSQSQAQAQSVAQVQPGVMVQRQRRTQVAVQEQGPGLNVMYEARELRHGRQSPAMAVVAGLMLSVAGLAWRRPRWALAKAIRRRR